MTQGGSRAEFTNGSWTRGTQLPRDHPGPRADTTLGEFCLFDRFNRGNARPVSSRTTLTRTPVSHVAVGTEGMHVLWKQADRVHKHHKVTGLGGRAGGGSQATGEPRVGGNRGIKYGTYT